MQLATSPLAENQCLQCFPEFFPISEQMGCATWLCHITPNITCLCLGFIYKLPKIHIFLHNFQERDSGSAGLEDFLVILQEDNGKNRNLTHLLLRTEIESKGLLKPTDYRKESCYLFTFVVLSPLLSHKCILLPV